MADDLNVLRQKVPAQQELSSANHSRHMEASSRRHSPQIQSDTPRPSPLIGHEHQQLQGQRLNSGDTMTPRWPPIPEDHLFPSLESRRLEEAAYLDFLHHTQDTQEAGDMEGRYWKNGRRHAVPPPFTADALDPRQIAQDHFATPPDWQAARPQSTALDVSDPGAWGAGRSHPQADDRRDNPEPSFTDMIREIPMHAQDMTTGPVRSARRGSGEQRTLGPAMSMTARARFEAERRRSSVLSRRAALMAVRRTEEHGGDDRASEEVRCRFRREIGRGS